ncbi:MAG: arginine--tRNA ligase [Clostridia bacterium]|nr:arginine--tRNA ligase [Clostridia bacterium]
MINFKQEIAKVIAKETNLNEKELETYIETPKDSNNGDYAFPCFRLAKELKKAPQVIASEIKENIQIDENIIEKIDIAGGYLNFYVNKSLMTKEVLGEVANSEDYGKSSLGNGKNIVIDYSAPNIAKPFHIGHLRSTVIGGALYNIYKHLGYNVIGVNHLGDYGTQFGKLIEGYKLWGQEYDIEKDPINELTKIYIRINNLCKEDEDVLEACRNNFKKLEDGDSYCVEIWKRFRDLSLKEFQKVYDLLGSKFDSWNGEAFYSDKMPEIIDILENTGKLVESQGARVIDLEESGINTPCIIEKTNGSTTYATRDLAAIMYRARTYDFDKALYVTSYEQVLHFKQVFEVAKLLGLDEKYIKGLNHISFGMVLLPTGKMSTREGNIVKLEDLLNEAIQRAEEIIEQKNPELENKEEVAKKVGIGAVIFNDLANSRVKDEIFDWNQILNFQGETGPYIQYTYVRTKSVLERVEKIPEIFEVKVESLLDEYSQKVIRLLYDFEDTLIQVTKKEEPSILSRYLIDLAKAFSSFYNENKIIVEDIDTQNARIYLTYAVGKILKIGAELLGIEMPNKM